MWIILNGIVHDSLVLLFAKRYETQLKLTRALVTIPRNISEVES